MPSRVRCFLLTPTDHIAVLLRRFAPDIAKRCSRQEPRYPGADVLRYEVHDREVEVGRETGTIESCLEGDSTLETVPHDDPRWPASCACGYVFAVDDTWQENRSRLYARSDTGELVTVYGAPAGALYYASWLGDITEYARNEPGRSLVCKTPGGEWLIDGPASNGPGWTRTGTPPVISVTPSIGIGAPQRMHGYLTNGWLEIDLP